MKKALFFSIILFVVSFSSSAQKVSQTGDVLFATVVEDFLGFRVDSVEVLTPITPLASQILALTIMEGLRWNQVSRDNDVTRYKAIFENRSYLLVIRNNRTLLVTYAAEEKAETIAELKYRPKRAQL